MLVDCWRNEPARAAWLWVLIPFWWVGAVIYAIARWWPRFQRQRGRSFSAEKQQQIQRAQEAAKNIGNAHQFYQLGDLYRETSQWKAAEEAYERALTKDSEHKQSLWGSALVAFHQQDLDRARERFQRLLSIEPNYKFGEAALIYGRVLLDAERWNEAVEHLRPVVQRSNSLEGRLMLARALKESGQPSAAREQVYLAIGSLRDASSLESWRSKRLFQEIDRLLKQLGNE